MPNRRQFIKQSTLIGLGALSTSSLFAYRGRPNEKITIGIVGANSRGAFLAQAFAKLPDVEVTYICDVDSTVIEKNIAAIEKLTGKKSKGITDVRKLLEAKDCDCVAIAAPDHWHAPATLMAVQAGKNVYVEKPCSHNPAEGEILVQAAQKYGRLIQMGNQRRSFPKIIEAMQALREGAIGRVYFAKGWYANSRKTIGIGKVAQPPATLDFDLWQGPAPRRAYKDNLVHYNWHWFWHWGTGEALNNGTHEIDVMRWGLGATYPTRVVSGGGRFAFHDDWETPDTQTITFEFPNNTAMSWEGRSCNGLNSEGSGRGVVFYGEKGSLLTNGGDDYKIFSLDNKLIREGKTDIQNAEGTNTVSLGEQLDSLHLVNFLEAVRGKTKLTSPISEGHASTLLPQLGNIAFRTGRALHCDPANGHILRDKAAMKMWAREYEKGWEMKV